MAKGASDSEKILTVSEATKKEILDHLKVPAEKIMVAYEGIDRKIKDQRSRIKDRELDPRFRGDDKERREFFLYVGNAYPHKNLERLIEAFRRFKNQGSGVRDGYVGGVELILVGR